MQQIWKSIISQLFIYVVSLFILEIIVPKRLRLLKIISIPFIHITISNHTSNLKISKNNKILKIDLHIYLVKYMNICNVRTYIVCIQWTYIFININQYSYMFYLPLDINYYFVNGNIMILGFTLSIEIWPAKPKNILLGFSRDHPWKKEMWIILTLK